MVNYLAILGSLIGMGVAGTLVHPFFGNGAGWGLPESVRSPERLRRPSMAAD